MYTEITDVYGNNHIIRYKDIFEYEVKTGVLHTDNLDNNGNNIIYILQEDTRETFRDWLLSQIDTNDNENNNDDMPDDRPIWERYGYTEPQFQKYPEGIRRVRILQDWNAYEVHRDVNGDPRYDDSPKHKLIIRQPKNAADRWHLEAKEEFYVWYPPIPVASFGAAWEVCDPPDTRNIFIPKKPEKMLLLEKI